MTHKAINIKAMLLTGMLCTATTAMAAAPANQGTFFGPTPYLSTADVPAGFYSLAGATVLDTLEDGSLDSTLVGSGGGSILSNGFGGARDSVDSDDGVINGTCGAQTAGRCVSWFNGAGNRGATFTFAGTGPLPTAFGLAWTDGAGTITFSALNADGQSLGSISASGFADGSFGATTAEDRFFGVQFAGGIRSITISNSAGGIEVDHIQYGQMAAAVPEPETYAMLLAGLGLMGAVARRRKQKL
ncbi:PEP-CTERM protein-sorting domain [Comamonadaceae bacterium]